MKKKRNYYGNVTDNGLKVDKDNASESNHLDTKMEAYINPVLTLCIWNIFKSLMSSETANSSYEKKGVIT